MPRGEPPSRDEPRFVQIACGSTGDADEHDHILYALDDRGAVWQFVIDKSGEGTWEPLTPPGPG